MLENKKIIVIYKSKYGSTKYYADWIAKNIDADLLEVSEAKIEKLKNYHTIVYGGPLFAFRISGVKFITKNIEKIKHKKIVIFSTGILSETVENRNTVIETNFNQNVRSQIKLFMLKGDFDIKKINLLDKMLVNTIRRKLKKIHEDKRDENMKEFLEIFEHVIERKDKKNAQSIIEYSNEQWEENSNNDEK